MVKQGFHNTKVANCTEIQNNLTVEVHNTFENLESIQQEWDAFVEQVSSDIFMTYDWCRIWWKYYGENRDLRVFVFRANGELVGIIPLFFEIIWLGPVYVKAAKIIGSDFTLSQFYLPIKKVYIQEVIRKLFSRISEDMFDVIAIGPIAGLYKYYHELKSAFDLSFKNSYTVLSTKTEVQTYFKIPNTWEEYLAVLKKKDRQLIKSAYRKMKKKNMVLSATMVSLRDFDREFKSFARTHQLFWQKKGRAGHFGDWFNSFAFHHEVAKAQLKKNRLRLLNLRLNGDCCAYQYSYKYGNVYFELLTGRFLSERLAQVDLGRVIFAEQIKKAISEDINSIDSMRGKYDYKLRLGGELFPIQKLLIVRAQIFAFLRIYLFRKLAKILDLCYYRMWYCRVVHLLPIKRKPLLKVWIRTNIFK